MMCGYAPIPLFEPAPPQVNWEEVYRRSQHSQATPDAMRLSVRERIATMPVGELRDHLTMCKLSLEEAQRLGVTI